MCYNKLRLSANKTKNMQGYKTYIGLVITVLGLIGWGDLVTSDQLAHVVDLTTELVGVCVAVYGNYKAHREIKALGGYR